MQLGVDAASVSKKMKAANVFHVSIIEYFNLFLIKIVVRWMDFQVNVFFVSFQQNVTIISAAKELFAL